MPTPSSTAARPEKPRIAASVALALLEVIQSQDLPDEILEDENVALTMPRKLGLSGVVEAQIRRYREEARRGKRVTDAEVADLVRLVIRRPDAEEVFFEVGAVLADGDEEPSGLRKVLPAALGMALARRRARKGLADLFGRRIGDFAKGPFVFEARAHPLIQADPGGDGCALVSGYLDGVLSGYRADLPEPVAHVECQARGGSLCRWTLPEG